MTTKPPAVERRQQEETEMSKPTCDTCPYEMAYDVQFRNMETDLAEVKARVAKLETTLARGVMLLVANLAGVVATLAQQLIR